MTIIKGKKKKNQINPQVVEKRRHERNVRKLFQRLGFQRIRTDGAAFTFSDRTGEIDDMFVFENIVVLMEYTVGEATSSHVGKKAILYSLIHKKQEEWIDFSKSKFPTFDTHVVSAGYLPSDYRVCICYCSTKGVSEELETNLGYIHFLDGTRLRYFDALAKTIHMSARHEFFKYLGLEFKDIAQEVKSSSSSSRKFEGFVLPESHSSFPPGFKIASFYADPDTLLTMSYVLRRDSWRDEHGTYQRVLMKGRMNEMRRYLTTEERVFVNNIIVTLPSDTLLNDIQPPHKNLDPKSIKTVTPASVAIPFQSNAIGIVDGQHRVFCYHEGVDQYEPRIKAMRGRQNLLVTGIVYPAAYKEGDKRQFEAKLFLEINDKQKRTNSEIKQSIELILRPYSTVAISKAVVQRLSASGALKGLLQTNYFDPPNLIRTTSIVSYGLRPLLKLDGTDSLFSAWPHAQKEKLQQLQKKQVADSAIDPLLHDYIDFCTQRINDLLIAAKKAEGPEKWKLPDKAKDRHLSPTVVNGYIVCLRRLVESNKLYTQATYEKKLQGLQKFSWSKYKSSHWKALGLALYSEFFT